MAFVIVSAAMLLPRPAVNFGGADEHGAAKLRDHDPRKSDYDGLFDDLSLKSTPSLQCSSA